MITQNSILKSAGKAASHKKNLVRLRRLLNSSTFQSDSIPQPWRNYFPSRSKLTEVTNVSTSTWKRWEVSGRINKITWDRHVLYHIPTLLDSIAKDEKIGNLIARNSSCQHKPRSKNPYLINYQVSLINGYVFTEIHYGNWKGTLICSQEIWQNEEKFKDLICAVVLAHTKNKPLKTPRHV